MTRINLVPPRRADGPTLVRGIGTKENDNMNSCYTCKHRHSHKEIESWEMPHIFWWIHICDARPSVANLKQFPFKNTGCTKYEKGNQ